MVVEGPVAELAAERGLLGSRGRREPGQAAKKQRERRDAPPHSIRSSGPRRGRMVRVTNRIQNQVNTEAVLSSVLRAP